MTSPEFVTEMKSFDVMFRLSVRWKLVSVSLPPGTVKNTEFWKEVVRVTVEREERL